MLGHCGLERKKWFVQHGSDATYTQPTEQKSESEETSKLNDVSARLYLNNGPHQSVEQGDDAAAGVPSLSLQETHTHMLEISPCSGGELREPWQMIYQHTELNQHLCKCSIWNGGEEVVDSRNMV